MLLLSHRCNISRNTPLGTNGRRTMTALASDVECLVLPMPGPASIQNGFELGKGYDFYFHDGQDVKVGDKLEWEGEIFSVQAVIPYKTPLGAHIQVLAKQEAN